MIIKFKTDFVFPGKNESWMVNIKDIETNVRIQIDQDSSCLMHFPERATIFIPSELKEFAWGLMASWNDYAEIDLKDYDIFDIVRNRIILHHKLLEPREASTSYSFLEES